MRVLITGASGFVGRHLIQYLQQQAIEIHGTTLGSDAIDGIITHQVDLRDAQATQKALDDARPDHIYHLAAQAFVPRSFEDPWETLENNQLAQLNLILSSLKMDPVPQMLVTSSAEIYGLVRSEDIPIHESLAPRPTSPYSVSKIAQDMLALQYHLSHNLPVVRVRPFNHIGPGQNERFVAPAFASQIARIEVGLQEPVMRVGNLKAERDFTDVRDIVRAYQLLIENGEPGEVYNVARGEAYSIQYLLDTLLSFSSVDISVEPDPDRMRPISLPVLKGDATRLRAQTGWEPQITFEDSLRDILEDCRERVREEAQSG